uniref:A disintegrin and metalloproteinase with thrombospondin motifs 12 n=1 Tax=Diabrotica virgifera virgifera TaxID=50390 RepID=A0A6P7GJF4_DIAVI
MDYSFLRPTNAFFTKSVPKRVTSTGEHLSDDVTTHHKSSDSVHFNISLEEDVYFLVLRPTNAFYTKSIVIERRSRDNYTRMAPSLMGRSCHFQGIIDGQESSRVAISTCNGLTGVIISNKGKYYIEPAHHPSKIVQPGHKHLIYKRSAALNKYPKRRKKKRRRQNNCGTRVPRRWTLVSMLFQDPSLGNSVSIVVVKIILIEDPQSEPVLNVSTNADVTLRSFCKWQLGLNPGKDSHPHHHDVAILVTRKDICARQEAPCGTLGVAHIGGMCKASRSCSVNEDNGIMSAHTIAHELGHNFGMIHDTEKTGCKRREGNVIHIMTPNFEADTVTVNWSNCSRKDITRFLDKGLGQCLKDKPKDLKRYKYPDLPAGVMYDANYQCKLQFGKKATLCTPPDEICLHLWCSINNTCTTLLRPAAEGTYCGKHK